MNIVRAHPPNYDQIRAAFKEAGRPGVIFAYGDTIFNPNGGKISEALLAHEEVHCGQQGNDPIGWWNRYIDDPAFRFGQELEAHQAEFRVASQDASRQVRRSILRELASRLSSPLYGSCGSREEAAELIAGGAA